ncbi:MAG TPA: penicillin-binding transpeptidase domain-containing protein [Bdellovibrionota bacterium]|jgi:cell division protein FtsI/penicillin-binding protein 2
MMKEFRPVLWLCGCAAALAVFATATLLAPKGLVPGAAQRGLSSIAAHPFQELKREEIASLLGDQSITSNHLKLDSFPIFKDGKGYNVHFTIDRDLQERIEDAYQRYSPSYAAFVAMDPETGKILAMVDYSSEEHKGNLALKASYPAASVFKVVTSAAALNDGKVRPNAIFPVNGRYGTLYKRNLREVVNRWTRFITIEEAFAKSVNTVFGRIAQTRVGSDALQKYANSFGFNQKIGFDMPLEMGEAVIPTDDDFGLAESGSGFTQKQTLNPVQGAMIASAVVNGGRIPSPYLVDEVTNQSGSKVYEAEVNENLFRPIDQETAKSLAMIMETTVTKGTARREFRDYNHHPVLSKLFIGGKTGSFTGMAPAGKYDWFVGFAQSSADPRKKIVFASMIVNRKYWKVKSYHVAREAILQHFQKINEREL